MKKNKRKGKIEEKKTSNKKLEVTKNKMPVGISIKPWLVKHNIKKWEWHPREVYAKKNNMTIATLQEWNKFFEKY